MARREDSTAVGPWFRAGTDILDDAKMWRLFRKNAGDPFRYFLLIARAKLSIDHTVSDGEVGLLLAGKNNPMTLRDIADDLRESSRAAQAFLDRLEEALPGAVIQEPSGAFRLTNYIKRQYDRPQDLPHIKRRRDREIYAGKRDGNRDGKGDGFSDGPRDGNRDGKGDASRARTRAGAPPEAEADPEAYYTEEGIERGGTDLTPHDLYRRYTEKTGRPISPNVDRHRALLDRAISIHGSDTVREAFERYLDDPFHARHGWRIDTFLKPDVLTEFANGTRGDRTPRQTRDDYDDELRPPPETEILGMDD